MSFAERVMACLAHVEHSLDERLPPANEKPMVLHQAMRYSVLSGGKRIRPLLCYASGEVLGVNQAELDDAACALEFIHAFSLIHDDLPAMDDDVLRRGRPTTHKAFGVATAILAGDALQTLAFSVLARADDERPATRLQMLAVLAEATGSKGMTGGQAIDLASEDKWLAAAELEDMDRHKTGRLIRASVLMPCCLRTDLDAGLRNSLDRFADGIGLAFQIRDDILDVEGDSAITGKTQGADAAHDKATYPALLGMEGAKRRADELYANALTELTAFGAAAESLRWMAEYIVHRDH